MLYLAGNHMREEGAMKPIRARWSEKSVTEAILEDELRRKKTSYGVNDTQGIQELFLGGTSMGPMGCHAVATML